MSEEKDNEAKENSVVGRFLAPIATALIVGGTAPWWVDLIQGEPEPNSSETSSLSTDTSGADQDAESPVNDDSINIQGSENTVTDDSVVASGESVIQQNSGSGSNISAGGDVSINEPFEVPKFEGQIQVWNDKVWSEESEINDFEGSEDFFDFIVENDQNVVYLNIWPYYSGNTVNLDRPTEIVVPPPYESVVGTTIYEIVDSEGGEFFYDPTYDSRIIKGYFKVLAVYPYQAGIQRIRLKSVAIEDVPR